MNIRVFRRVRLWLIWRIVKYEFHSQFLQFSDSPSSKPFYNIQIMILLTLKLFLFFLSSIQLSDFPN